MIDEEPNSVYRFWLASTVEGFLRGGPPEHQLFVAKCKGTGDGSVKPRTGGNGSTGGTGNGSNGNGNGGGGGGGGGGGNKPRLGLMHCLVEEILAPSPPAQPEQTNLFNSSPALQTSFDCLGEMTKGAQCK